MKVLITGVAGFIGSNLAQRLLADGHEVTGIDNLRYGVAGQIPDGVRFHRLDIRSPDIRPLFRGMDAAFHLAAKNCISDCQQDPLETADVNVTGFVNVLESARLAALPKLIYAESSALYEGSDRLPSAEDDVLPRSFYAVSKWTGMAWADAYRRFFGLRLTALRYFCVYGPRQDYRRTVPPLMSAFILAALRGQAPVIYGDGSKRRDFIYVDDVNDFHLRCLADPRTDGRTFNLGSGANHSVLEILEQVQRLTGTRLAPSFKPDLPGEALATLADISAARAIGWSPRVSLEEGLRRSIDHIRREVLPQL